MNGFVLKEKLYFCSQQIFVNMANTYKGVKYFSNKRKVLDKIRKEKE